MLRSSSWLQKHVMMPKGMSWRQKHMSKISSWRQKRILTLKGSSWCQKHVMTSQSVSWHQKYFMTPNKIWRCVRNTSCHHKYDVKEFVIASKTCHDIKNTSWRQKMSKSASKGSLWCQKYVMTSKIRHEIKKFIKNMSWCQKVHEVTNMSWMSKDMPWRQEHVMTSKCSSWRQR